jgi:hypothetical protein
MVNTKYSMSNITILIVEKNGDIKEQTLKTFDETELYKKAGFKNADGFKSHVSWGVEELDGKTYSISVYGKTTGRANQENKFEFPPPIDNTLFFGNCIIVNKVNNNPTSVSRKEWDSIYDYLYGGFEDIGDEDSEEEDDDDDDEPRTKTGYKKDGFVVDDDDEEDDDEEDEEEDEDEDEEEDEPPKKKQQKKTTKKTNKQSKAKQEKKPLTVFESLTADEENYLDCTSELSEESYV